MSAYDEPTEKCPYCKHDMNADWVDVGVGSVQCGPYHCANCGASEIGPELGDWYYKDRKGAVLFLPGKRLYSPYGKTKYRIYGKPVLKPGHPFTDIELETGYYQNRHSPYANTVQGQLVDHKSAKNAYELGILDEKDELDEILNHRKEEN